MTTRRKVTYAVLAVAVVAFAVWAKHRIDGLSSATQATDPIFRWEYLFKREQTPSELWTATRQHLELTFVPVVLGTILSAGLAVLVLRFNWLRGLIFTFAGFLYTIPSLALFGVLATYNTNFQSAVIALTSYTLLIITRNIVAGIDAVPQPVLDAADGLGMSRSQRLRKVEVPLAMPVILTGIRVATVTTVGLVGISVVIQLGGLATYIFDGFRRQYSTVMLLGSVAIVLLAVVLDLLIRGIEWVATPWAHRRVAS
ncbi:ABC transporter permease [Aquihabitans sp. McL0605]|uniref:ABC transporter permease n=1 Tax=Aquihabitans sp. McL0605 TaxID=3415671 RepID=UPI003CF5C124